MNGIKTIHRDEAQPSYQTEGRWLYLFLLAAIIAVSAVFFLSENRIEEEAQTRPDVASQNMSLKFAGLPVIEVKHILASPFQAQLTAQLRVDGVERNVIVGQALSEDVKIQAIDVNSVIVLHHGRLHRYELAQLNRTLALSAQEKKDMQASIQLLSHEFRQSATGVEVYSATHQGLSAALGLQNGDQVNKINGKLVSQPEDIARLLSEYHPSQVLEFAGSRQGQAMSWIYQAQADD